MAWQELGFTTSLWFFRESDAFDVSITWSSQGFHQLEPQLLDVFSNKVDEEWNLRTPCICNIFLCVIYIVKSSEYMISSDYITPTGKPRMISIASSLKFLATHFSKEILRRGWSVQKWRLVIAPPSLVSIYFHTKKLDFRLGARGSLIGWIGSNFSFNAKILVPPLKKYKYNFHHYDLAIMSTFVVFSAEKAVASCVSYLRVPWNEMDIKQFCNILPNLNQNACNGLIRPWLHHLFVVFSRVHYFWHSNNLIFIFMATRECPKKLFSARS